MRPCTATNTLVFQWRTELFIKVTKWEAQRIIDILRCRVVVPSHYAWADETAAKIEVVLERLKENKTWQKKSKK